MQLADPRYSPGMSKPINDDATTTHVHLHLTTSTGSILLAVKTLLRDGRPVFVRGDGAIPSEGEGTTGLGALNGGRRQERLCGRRNRRGVLRGSEPLAHEAIHLQRRLRSATSTRAGLENASTSDSPPGDPSAYCPEGRGGDPSGGGNPQVVVGGVGEGRPVGALRGGRGGATASGPGCRWAPSTGGTTTEGAGCGTVDPRQRVVQGDCLDGRGGDPSGGDPPQVLYGGGHRGTTTPATSSTSGGRRRGRSFSGRSLRGGDDGIWFWVQVGTIDGGNDDGRCWTWDEWTQGNRGGVEVIWGPDF